MTKSLCEGNPIIMNMESGIFLRSTNPETFIERCETLLLTAQVAKLKISEAVKCSDFLRALPASSDNLRSEWRTQAKFASAEEDKNFDALSQVFNTHVLQLQRQKEKEQPTVIFAGRQRRQDERRELELWWQGPLQYSLPQIEDRRRTQSSTCDGSQ